MKILKRTMDYVFFSENLKRYYPKVYNELTKYCQSMMYVMAY